MKLKQIALLLAGFTVSAAAFAAPVTIAQIEAARVAGQLDQAWISGASAPTRTVYEGWVGSGAGVGCDATTNTIFTNQGGTNVIPGALGNFLAYACTRAGKVSVLYHTLDGGSLNAYAPHTVGTKLARLKYVGSPTANTCVVAATSYVDATNADNNAAVFKSCALVGAAVPATGPTPGSNASNQSAVNADSNSPNLPVGGFSDVEAALFPATIGGGDVSSKGTEGNANVTQVFGVAVSVPLYRALQAAQSLSDVNATTYDPAVAPNITKAQYASIAAAGGAYQTDWQPLVGAAAGLNKKVILARRVATSGTQATSNSFFLASPCAKALGADLGAAAVGDSSTTFEVFEGSSTTNVKTRLTTASNAAPATNNEFAIGIMSIENNWRDDLLSTTAATTAGYRFIKVNGIHPEAGDTANGRATTISGAYELAKELKNFTANTATGFGAAIVGQITAALSNPPVAACAVLPRGLALNPLAGSSCGAAQVAKATNLGNNCSPFQLVQ